MKKTILISIMFLLLVTTVSADYIFKGESPIDINLPCINNNTLCSDTATCNITIFSPNNTVIINNQLMTNSGAYFNYTINKTETEDSGDYPFIVLCKDGAYTGYSNLKFTVTPTGKGISTEQGLASIGLLLAMIFVTGLFIYGGFKFSKSDHFYPLSLYLILVALILTINILYLSYKISNDILYPLSLGGLQFTIWFGIMYAVVGIATLVFALYIIRFIKKWYAEKLKIKREDKRAG